MSPTLENQKTERIKKEEKKPVGGCCRFDSELETKSLLNLLENNPDKAEETLQTWAWNVSTHLSENIAQDTISQMSYVVSGQHLEACGVTMTSLVKDMPEFYRQDVATIEKNFALNPEIKLGILASPQSVDIQENVQMLYFFQRDQEIPQKIHVTVLKFYGSDRDFSQLLDKVINSSEAFKNYHNDTNRGAFISASSVATSFTDMLVAVRATYQNSSTRDEKAISYLARVTHDLSNPELVLSRQRDRHLQIQLRAKALLGYLKEGLAKGDLKERVRNIAHKGPQIALEMYRDELNKSPFQRYLNKNERAKLSSGQSRGKTLATSGLATFAKWLRLSERIVGENARSAARSPNSKPEKKLNLLDSQNGSTPKAAVGLKEPVQNQADKDFSVRPGSKLLLQGYLALRNFFGAKAREKDIESKPGNKPGSDGGSANSFIPTNGKNHSKEAAYLSPYRPQPQSAISAKNRPNERTSDLITNRFTVEPSIATVGANGKKEQILSPAAKYQDTPTSIASITSEAGTLNSRQRQVFSPSVEELVPDFKITATLQTALNTLVEDNLTDQQLFVRVVNLLQLETPQDYDLTVAQQLFSSQSPKQMAVEEKLQSAKPIALTQREPVQVTAATITDQSKLTEIQTKPLSTKLEAQGDQIIRIINLPLTAENSANQNFNLNPPINQADKTREEVNKLIPLQASATELIEVSNSDPVSFKKPASLSEQTSLSVQENSSAAKIAVSISAEEQSNLIVQTGERTVDQMVGIKVAMQSNLVISPQKQGLQTNPRLHSKLSEQKKSITVANQARVSTVKKGRINNKKQSLALKGNRRDLLHPHKITKQDKSEKIKISRDKSKEAIIATPLQRYNHSKKTLSKTEQARLIVTEALMPANLPDGLDNKSGTNRVDIRILRLRRSVALSLAEEALQRNINLQQLLKKRKKHLARFELENLIVELLKLLGISDVECKAVLASLMIDQMAEKSIDQITDKLKLYATSQQDRLSEQQL